MTTARGAAANICPAPPNYEIYPATHFHRAPTSNKWVKLSGADIQRLRRELNFEGQNINFHLNRPIQYVYAIGVVVQIDHVVTRYNTRFTALKLDDGSGVVLEVKIPYLGQEKSQAAKKGDANGVPASEDEDGDEAAYEAATSSSLMPLTAKQTTIHTPIPDLTLTCSPQSDYTIHLSSHPVELGTVLKAKGTLTHFRDIFQMQLLRASHVHTIDEEIAAWEDYNGFVRNVLSKPWVLSSAEIEGLEMEEEEKVKKARAEEKKRREKMLAYERYKLNREGKRREREGKSQKREERKEAERAREARELDGNALDMVGWKPCAKAELVVDTIKEDARARSEAAIPTMAPNPDQERKQRQEQQLMPPPPLPPPRPAQPRAQIQAGFVRASYLMQPLPDTADIPWHHESKVQTRESAQNKRSGVHDEANDGGTPMSDLPMVGPRLGIQRTVEVGKMIDGEHEGPWWHKRAKTEEG